jgi:hypothetical protein
LKHELTGQNHDNAGAWASGGGVRHPAHIGNPELRKDGGVTRLHGEGFVRIASRIVATDGPSVGGGNTSNQILLKRACLESLQLTRNLIAAENRRDAPFLGLAGWHCSVATEVPLVTSWVFKTEPAPWTLERAPIKGSNLADWSMKCYVYLFLRMAQLQAHSMIGVKAVGCGIPEVAADGSATATAVIYY